MSGATTGKVGMYRDRVVAYQNQRVGRFVTRADENVTSAYIRHLVGSTLFSAKLKVYLEQGAQPNISGRQIESLVFQFPRSRVEQQAIATALSDADAYIESLEQLITKKRQIKQGVMQELLTEKRRLPGFEGKWEKYRFEQLFQFLRNASNSRSELSQDGEVAYVHYGDIHTHESEFIVPSALQTFIGRDKVKNSARLLKGDLLMVDASEDTAAIGKAVEVLSVEEHEAVAGLHTMVLRGNKELLSDGFKGYLQHFPSVRSALVRLATGVSVYGITKSGVRAVEVAIPSVQEQAAIAEVLGSLQAEITALDSKLSKGRHLKQAMMQQLLTGKIRLV
jgi:type I restriction enzyme S subunit